MLDAQEPTAKELIGRFESMLKESPSSKLDCSVTNYRPNLDYGLRIWSGYNLTLPARQFNLTGGEVTVTMFRVRPDDAPDGAKYFWGRAELPNKPPAANLKRVEFTLAGGFLLGTGRYRVDWMMVDDKGRSCRSHWSLNANSKDASPLTPPNTVEPISAEFWKGFSDKQVKPQRATIFLHAAAVQPRRYVAKLSAWDRQVLLSSLISLLREAKFTSACVVVFDLERRQILFREPNFNERAMRRLARQLAGVDLSTISMDILKSGPSGGPFLLDMLRQETKEGRPSDSFIFLGTTWRAGPKLPPAPEDLREAVPPTYFLAFTPPGGPLDTDSVSSLVKSLRGKVLSIRQPADLAGAIRTLSNGH